MLFTFIAKLILMEICEFFKVTVKIIGLFFSGHGVYYLLS